MVQVLNILPRNVKYFLGSIVLNIVLFSVMVFYIFRYNKQLNKPLPEPTAAVEQIFPEWRYGLNANEVILDEIDPLNRYWVQTTADGPTNSLKFPTASVVIQFAINQNTAYDIVEGQKFYMVINNLGGVGKTLTFPANTGNTLIGFSDGLANNKYLIAEIEFTSLSPPAVQYKSIQTGDIVG